MQMKNKMSTSAAGGAVLICAKMSAVLSTFASVLSLQMSIEWKKQKQNSFDLTDSLEVSRDH